MSEPSVSLFARYWDGGNGCTVDYTGRWKIVREPYSYTHYDEYGEGKEHWVDNPVLYLECFTIDEKKEPIYKVTKRLWGIFTTRQLTRWDVTGVKANVKWVSEKYLDLNIRYPTVINQCGGMYE